MALAEAPPDPDLDLDERRQLQLAPFVEMNARAKKTGRRIPWEERLAEARRQWPGIPWTEDEWVEALMDIELMGAIIRDIIKLDSAEPGRAMSFDTRAERTEAWRRFKGEDYATCPFAVAFRALGSLDDGELRSMSNLAHKTGLPRSRCHRLVTSEIEPTAGDMEAIATAFGKRPSYFAEYRAGFVVSRLAEKLQTAPDATIRMYQQLLEATG